MQKWEYCAIRGIRDSSENFQTSYPCIIEFLPNNKFKSTRITKMPNTPENVVVANVIAQLGEDGWELVNAASTGRGYEFTLFFKRPKE